MPDRGPAHVNRYCSVGFGKVRVSFTQISEISNGSTAQNGCIIILVSNLLDANKLHRLYSKLNELDLNMA